MHRYVTIPKNVKPVTIPQPSKLNINKKETQSVWGQSK